MSKMTPCAQFDMQEYYKRIWDPNRDYKYGPVKAKPDIKPF